VAKHLIGVEFLKLQPNCEKRQSAELKILWFQARLLGDAGKHFGSYLFLIVKGEFIGLTSRMDH
jgi:hypothetical protein